VFLVCLPLASGIFAGLLHRISYLDGVNRYNPPYDYHITIPAYLTFIEPVIGSFAIGTLTSGASKRLVAARNRSSSEFHPNRTAPSSDRWMRT
jgi:hypothetical protein